MEQLGKLTYRELRDTDLDKLEIFCNECNQLGYLNNQDFKSIKLEQMKLPFGKYYIGLDNDKIFTLAGVHQFPEININSYRVLFRGACLPGYATVSTNPIGYSPQFRELLYQQIIEILGINDKAEFYITTNSEHKLGNGDSNDLNDKVVPRTVARRNLVTLYEKDMVIYNVKQNVWKVNVIEYLRQREQYLGTH